LTKIDIYNEAKAILINYIIQNNKIAAAEYRDLLNTNRKNAIGLLEYFDMIKVTKRVGNDRILF
ncbi:MAG: SelB C-terminal domain-containing protein, partial [Sedimentibacter sp.]